MKRLPFILAVLFLPHLAAAQALGSGRAFDPALQKLHELFASVSGMCLPCASVRADAGASFAQRCGRPLDTSDYVSLATAAPSYSAAISILTFAHVNTAAELPAPLATRYWAAVDAIPCSFPVAP